MELLFVLSVPLELFQVLFLIRCRRRISSSFNRQIKIKNKAFVDRAREGLIDLLLLLAYEPEPGDRKSRSSLSGNALSGATSRLRVVTLELAELAWLMSLIFVTSSQGRRFVPDGRLCRNEPDDMDEMLLSFKLIMRWRLF